MSRNLVLCLDGTNNEYDATNTNVVKLYALLERDGQLAYYQPGIGTMPPPGMWGRLKKWWVTRLDLAIAWLLEKHVCDAYRFLMRYYEEGDQIYLFGFSRGAYSVRVLAGMLYKVGLLSRGNEELIPFAWDIFQKGGNVDLATGFRHTFCRKVKVHFLGVWDTVSSVGWAEWSPQHFQYTQNNPCVEVARHAIALDERRAYFVQNLWGAEPGQDVKEVWFPGVHCDVGGGYLEADAGLSKITLEWMVREAERFGLRTNAAAKAAIIPAASTFAYSAPSATAKKHESLHSFWWIPEFLPKRIKDPDNHWAPKWIVPLGRHRQVREDARIHPSVFDRQASDPIYCPPNLPRIPHRGD